MPERPTSLLHRQGVGSVSFWSSQFLKEVAFHAVASYHYGAAAVVASQLRAHSLSCSDLVAWV